jgi:two-component system phosphate regulon response regulator PhoB
MPTKILVVEDNPDVMFVLLSAVDSQKCEFIGVEEGTSVLETALREKPALIIIDVMLPGMNGLEVCRRIRATNDLKDVKILGISGHVASQDIEPGLFNEFLEKPFDVSVLVHTMARLLGWSKPNAIGNMDDVVLPDQEEDEPIDLTWNDDEK